MTFAAGPTWSAPMASRTPAIYDIAFLRCIPNMVVMAASDENECRQMLSSAYKYPGPAAVRYPRGAGAAVAEALAAEGIVKSLLILGLPDRFIDHGDVAQLLAGCGLDAAGIAASIRQRFIKEEPRLVVNR